MEPEKSDNYNDNFQNFIKIQKELVDSFPAAANLATSVLPMDELFKFFEDHFTEFQQKENLRVSLAFIHRCLKYWISGEDYKNEDIGLSMIYFIAEHRENDSDLNIVLQIIYQIINSIKMLKNADISVTQKLLLELITMLDELKCRKLLSNCIACIQLYMEVFPESKKHMTTLWLNLKTKLETNLKNGKLQETEIDILIQLIDDFKSTTSNFDQEPILINTIKYLLKSDQRKYRKCGYYLLKKMFQYVMESIRNTGSFWASNDHEKQIERSWIIYITILENLEEEQSHLILPSLENLKELIENKYFQNIWLDIIYMRMLIHNNNLVLRWSIEFILKTFSCSDLCDETLKYLLQATNSTLLFNYEGYFLEKSYFNMFLRNDLQNLLRLLPEIENWKSIPMYMWLMNINESSLTKSLTYEEILKISACVRKLQNSKIRREVIYLCEMIFENFIDKMTMEEYVRFIETLYNTSDGFKHYRTLFQKKISLQCSTSKVVIFRQRFYEIFIANIECDFPIVELIEFLNDIPVSQHGWLKFFPFHFILDKKDRIIIKKLYQIDLDSLQTNDLNKLIKEFEYYLLELPIQDKHEQRECHQSAISFYIYNVNDLCIDNNEDTIRFILNFGMNPNTVTEFAMKLFKNVNNKISLWFIDELLKYNINSVNELIFKHIKQFYDYDVFQMYITKNYIANLSIKFELDFCKNDLCLLTDFYLQGVSSKGETRVEQAFLYKHDLEIFQHSNYLRSAIDILADENYVEELLQRHIKLTKKKPRYFENSNEHRIKMRIAYCILYCIRFRIKIEKLSHDILDTIWNIVLNENNQLNIVYIYEYVLGKFETRENLIINKLKEAQNLSAGQQVSILSISYAYFSITSSSSSAEICQKIVSYFLALTMGANFQTRLLAQMSLYNLMLNESCIDIEGRHSIMNSIKYAAGEKFLEYINDIRLHLHTFELDFDLFDKILYITNAPFDEYSGSICLDGEIKDCHENFMKKNKFTKEEEETITNNMLNKQIQRKMNPVNDLTEPHNLIIYPTEEKSAEMFVIATLIDKLPNLGGIARTCEVMGIQNLVMSSKMDTLKSDFKNLSMTAEKTLNIIEVKPKDLREFLMDKKLQGFAIVGAEQTNNSENFSDFKFPQKCILLLGHEKDGIPAPLLGLLDYAVEIPQFGQVRSLNVHVTGALFMWEFCKQHFVKK